MITRTGSSSLQSRRFRSFFEYIELRLNNLSYFLLLSLTRLVLLLLILADIPFGCIFAVPPFFRNSIYNQSVCICALSLLFNLFLRNLQYILGHFLLFSIRIVSIHWCLHCQCHLHSFQLQERRSKIMSLTTLEALKLCWMSAIHILLLHTLRPFTSLKWEWLSIEYLSLIYRMISPALRWVAQMDLGATWKIKDHIHSIGALLTLYISILSLASYWICSPRGARISGGVKSWRTIWERSKIRWRVQPPTLNTLTALPITFSSFSVDIDSRVVLRRKHQENERCSTVMKND